MKQEKGIIWKASNNIGKGVKNSARSKLKQTTIVTPIKNAAKVPLSAKVNSTWSNILDKNKVPTIGTNTLSNSNKCNEFRTNDPVRKMSFLIAELKTKLDVALPGNRAVKNVMENILKTFSQMNQTFGIKNTWIARPVQSQTIKPRLSVIGMKMVDIEELRQKNETLDENLKGTIEENIKLKKENESKECQLLNLQKELNISKKSIEKLESALNESVNTERETIANYEQQCKRLQNEIKTLQDSARRKESSVNNFNKNLGQKLIRDKLKYQKELAFKKLEKEKLMTLLKYHEMKVNSTRCEFCNIYKLIQKYVADDQNQQMQSIFSYQTDFDKKNSK